MRARYKAEDAVADNNVWYEDFSTLTFATSFAVVTKEQGRAFISHYRERYCSGSAPSEAEVVALRSLENTIDELMTNVDSRGAFVRLNTRSPKDAVAIDRTKFLDQTRGFTIHDQLALFFDLSMSSLRVYSGKEAVDLLLSSERTFVDILQAFDADEYDNGAVEKEGDSDIAKRRHEWDLEICVRQWEENLREDLEFRGFVHNYELIGVSQYNTYCRYPLVIQYKNIIEQRLQSFYLDCVKSRLTVLDMPNTVVDFAILPQEGNKVRPGPFSPRFPFSEQSLSRASIVVIELNPYNKRTGAGLFKWEDENTLDAKNVEGRIDFRLVPCVDVAIKNSVTRNCTISNKYESHEDHTPQMLDYLLQEADSVFKNKHKESVPPKDNQENSPKCIIS